MKRFILILATMVIVVLPYLFIIPQLASYNIILYNVFLLIGLCYGIVMFSISVEDGGNSNRAEQILSFIVNSIAWPSCMILLAFSRWKYKRNSLFG